ncbi:MAG: SdpI family protein [Chitinophagaceae bacterium]
MTGNFLIHCLSSASLLGGMIFFLGGKIMQRFPPQWPNYWYGYRSMSALQTRETFDAANIFSAALMINYAMALMVIGLMSAVFFMDNYWWLFLGAGALALVIATILLVVKTEKHIASRFDKNGNPRR